MIAIIDYKASLYLLIDGLRQRMTQLLTTRERLALFGWRAARFEGGCFVAIWMIAACAFGIAPSQHTLTFIRLIYIGSLLILSILSLLTFPLTFCAQGRQRIVGASLTFAVSVLSFTAVGFTE